MKLTPAYIESQVLYTDYAYDGTHTTCTITTHHGSKHVGTSGCLDPANYDKSIGEQIARKNAVDQLWALEGYFFSKLGLAASKIDPVKIITSRDTSSDGDAVAVLIGYVPHYADGGLVTAPPAVNVVNNSATWLYHDPQFSRDVLAAVLANKSKLRFE